MNQTMILDIDGAHRRYIQKNGPIYKTEFLQLIGMSMQTANNYQNGLSRNKILTCAYNIKELTGMSLDEIIKPINK